MIDWIRVASVDTGAAVENVGCPVQCSQRVVAIVAIEAVAIEVRERCRVSNEVVAGTTAHPILPLVTMNEISAALAHDHVVAVLREKSVRTEPAQHGVVTRAGHKGIVTAVPA